VIFKEGSLIGEKLAYLLHGNLVDKDGNTLQE
jgi:hypothetical protein